MDWLEVSLSVSSELAEAVADVLARFAPNGVVTERGVKFINEEDEGIPAGNIIVRAYLPADDHLEKTRQKLEEALFYLSMIQSLPTPTFTPIADQNWMEAWQVHYQPIPVGKKLIIVPAWLDSPDKSRIPIKINPGMAFGTGTHPTTQLCLELIETIFSDQSSNSNRPCSIIDIGCGSGILSIAALKLGAESALGVDIDEAAIKAARENAKANAIPQEKFLLGIGSVTEILAGNFGYKQAPLVLVNILASVIIHLLNNGLASLIAPGGALILSGILSEQTDSVLSSAQEQGFRIAQRIQREDWTAIYLTRLIN